MDQARWEGEVGGKAGQKRGLKIYNWFGCQVCKLTFHKTTGYQNHQGIKGTNALFSQPSCTLRSAPYPSSSPSSKAPEFMDTRTIKILGRYPTQKDNDELDIGGDTERDQENEEKTNQSAGKKTLKSQRKKGAETKGVKQIRELSTKEVRPKLVWEKNVDGREVPETKEGIKKNETLEEAASKRKVEAIDKHDTNKEEGVIKQELEPQGTIPGGKNQAGSSPVQGTELKDNNRSRERPGEIKAEVVEFTYRPKLEQINRTWGLPNEAKGEGEGRGDQGHHQGLASDPPADRH